MGKVCEDYKNKIFFVCLEPMVHVKNELSEEISVEEVSSMDQDADFTEYMTGRKIPPQGIPGLDLSDPKQLAEFARLKPKKSIDDVARTIACPHKVCCLRFHFGILDYYKFGEFSTQSNCVTVFSGISKIIKINIDYCFLLYRDVLKCFEIILQCVSIFILMVLVFTYVLNVEKHL